MKKLKNAMKRIVGAVLYKVAMLAILLVSGPAALMAQNTAGDYTAGTNALTTVAEEIAKYVPIMVKLCYAIGQFGNYTLLIFNSVFLLFFYTDIIQISSAAATVIIMIARAWDAINDPMMGIIVDKAHSSEGK